MERAVAAGNAAKRALGDAGAAAVAVAKHALHVHATLTPLPPLAGLPDLSSHTLSILSNRAYIFGGDTDHPTISESKANVVNVLTLPTDLALGDTDYKAVEAKGEEDVPKPRAGHCAATIGNRIYIFGGRPPTTHPTKPTHTEPLDEHGVLYGFDTVKLTWKSSVPQTSRCVEGLPAPRTYGSLTASPHPKASEKGEDMTMSPVGAEDPEDSGTLFLHGGYDSEGKGLDDVWAYDVGSGTWSPWPKAPGLGHVWYEDGREDRTGHGGRLWWVGTGNGPSVAGSVAFIHVDTERFDDGSGVGELGVAPGSRGWESFLGESGSEEKTGRSPSPPPPGYGGPISAGSAQALSHQRPSARKGSSLVPITTGQGRRYLLLIYGDAGEGAEGDIWAFHLPSQASDHWSATKIKDRIMKAVGKETGEGKWGVVQVTVDEDKGAELVKGTGSLGWFGADASGDWGPGRVVGWGGVKLVGIDGKAQSQVGGGWCLSVE